MSLPEQTHAVGPEAAGVIPHVFDLEEAAQNHPGTPAEEATEEGEPYLLCPLPEAGGDDHILSRPEGLQHGDAVDGVVGIIRIHGDKHVLIPELLKGSQNSPAQGPAQPPVTFVPD